jgi:hypothetical protein
MKKLIQLQLDISQAWAGMALAVSSTQRQFGVIGKE